MVTGNMFGGQVKAVDLPTLQPFRPPKNLVKIFFGAFPRAQVFSLVLEDLSFSRSDFLGSILDFRNQVICSRHDPPSTKGLLKRYSPPLSLKE